MYYYATILLHATGKILRYCVNHGELVKIKAKEKVFTDQIGLILDSMEMTTGFIWYEVMIDNERHWFDEVDLEVISANR
jgi:hypothetical protein|tara:strand:+ start:45 stop:281 length:237 start_codon:yes stop_codon:yes gene_type:complete